MENETKVTPTKKTSTKKAVAVKPTELAVVRKLTIDNFKTPGAIKETVDAVKAHYEGLVFDMSTKESRAECTAVLKEIKTNADVIFNTRKGIADEIKSLPKIVDAEGKYAKDELDKFIAKVGAPLAEWKQAEKDKKAAKEREKLQKQIDSDREIALMMMERDLMFIEKGEAFMKAEAEHAAAEKAKQDVADQIENQRLAAENAKLLQKQAEKAAADAKAANEKIKADAEAAKIAWEAGAAEREAKAKADEIKRCIDANYSSLMTYKQNIEMCQSFDVLEKNSGIFAGLKVCQYGYLQEKANILIEDIIAIDQALRNRFSNEQKQRELDALIKKVHIIFPNDEVEKMVMNDLINCITTHGLLWEKQGDNTLNIKLPEVKPVEPVNEWDLQ